MNRDFVVIGGGIVGLAIARRIRHHWPGASVLVLEKEFAVGLHASGRNSGVLHAGFYYAPDSLKARLTAQGNRLLREFCAEHDLPVRNCGKVVVASREDQLPALDELARRGAANGVPLEVVDEAGLAEIEPLAHTVDRAIWSPTTAVADPVSVTRAMARGLEVRLGTPALAAGPGWVDTPGGRIAAGHVVNAAGLYADRVADWFGFCDDYEVLPFKGLYWYGGWPVGRLQRHVYPVPDPRNPFLGVHFTVTAEGVAKVGPTAIPVLWREAYNGPFRFDAGEALHVATALPRFLASEHHDAPGLIAAEAPKYSRRYLVAQARHLVPSARARDFRIKGRPGIRAQLLHKQSGRLEMDFVVRGDEHSTHVLNAVSPAWTSSLAFADHVVAGIPL